MAFRESHPGVGRGTRQKRSWSVISIPPHTWPRHTLGPERQLVWDEEHPSSAIYKLGGLSEPHDPHL